MAYDLSLDEIADRIIDAVLNERHINRESLRKIIRPILKIWLKKTDGFRRQKAPKSKLQFTIENREIQQKYWMNKLKDMVGKDNMQSYYDELDSILVAEGYKKPSV